MSAPAPKKPRRKAPPVSTLVPQRDGFLLDGQPFQIRSGEMHFARVPRPYWRHRLQMARAMGLNTVSAYLFWSVHEPRPGEFVFTGQADVAAYVRLAAAEGLKVILRPGPYACAEWDFGGLPPWLLATPDIRVRCSDARFTAAARRYLLAVGRELAKLQISRGGPILLVQVENEYGSYGDDHAYMAFLRDTLVEAGFDVPLFTCDGPGAFRRGSVAKTFPVANFPEGPEENLRELRAFSPDTPLACGEFYPGWFDHWGERNAPVGPERSTRVLGWMHERKISFSIYMFHGGTSFGYSAGANTGRNDEYQPTTSSYDYGSPLTEAGWPNTKFTALRTLFSQDAAAPLPPVPATLPVIAVPRFSLTESAALFDHLPKPVRDVQPRPMEAYGQNYGLILYRSRLHAGPGAKLTIRELHDYGHVYLDGRRHAVLDRRLGQNATEIPVRPADVALDILVEAMGRVNYGPFILDRKGITDHVAFPVPYPAGIVMGWQVYNLPCDDAYLKKLKFGKKPRPGPAFHRGFFSVKATGDTFLDLRGWQKGLVWVNGHHLGRFWHIGPQQTLFLPGCWLKQGRNEVVVLDLESTGRGSLAGLKAPVHQQAAAQ